MPATLVAVLVALVGGLAIGLQNPMASLMGQRIGILQGTFIVHFGGTLLAGALLLIVPGGQMSAWRTVPWYALGAGALGVALISAISFSMPRLGAAATVGIVLTAQLGVSAWLDHFGYLGVDVNLFDGSRLLGMLLLVAGAYLVLR